MWCVRVAVVNGGALSFPAAGLFHTIVVLKLTAIVHRDALKHGVEVLAQTALQAVERPDHAGGGVVRHREDDARPGEPFCEHHQRPAGAHGDGLPLGYQTSQLFALLFLDDFDHFVKEQLHIQYYGRYMDDFFLIHPDKEYLQFCLREIRAYMDSLGLELNEKTQIFPIRNGIDFLGFHTYLTESGKVIRKLRHSSIKRMRAKLRHWEKEYPAGLVTREQILQSWQAWDAHAAHGNTWALRQQVRDRVQNILKEEI